MKRELNAFGRGVSAVLGVIFLALACIYVFNLHPLEIVLPENSYLYILLGLGLFQAYIVYPPVKNGGRLVLLLDILLGALSLGISLYLALNGRRITAEGWMLLPPDETVVWLCAILAVLVLESLRRVAGLALFILCLVFALFPLFADLVPPPFFGNSFSLSETITMHVLDSQSLVGIPMTVTGTLLVGYIFFGVVLNKTGGGQFFLDAASSLMGRYRGGAGKVAVMASALFGSMSGSSISNVMTTGVVTIPAMKRSGFKPAEAGAIEACASTGGMLMPPVMGAVAFLMAQFLGIPYFNVVVAAAVPSFLFYTGLLVVLDARAGRKGLLPLPRHEIPPLKKTLVEGWPYIATLAALVVFLYWHLEAQAPFGAIVLLVICIALFKRGILGLSHTVETFAELSISISELIATIAAVGFIIGAMSMTGIGTALSSELVKMAGGNAYLLIVMGAVASFILGMGLSASACYIFLAVTLAPALVTQGFNEIAVHLFILYWAIISNITPPVALACFPAARLAGADYFKVGFNAVAFGFVVYFVPFAFILNPAMILQGDLPAIVVSVFFAFAGILVAAFGIGRRAPFIGDLPLPLAALFVACGLGVMLATGFEVRLIVLCVLAVACAAGLFLRGRNTRALVQS